MILQEEQKKLKLTTTDSNSIALFYRCDMVFDLQKDFRARRSGTNSYVEKIFELVTDIFDHATDKDRFKSTTRHVGIDKR